MKDKVLEALEELGKYYAQSYGTITYANMSPEFKIVKQALHPVELDTEVEEAFNELRNHTEFWAQCTHDILDKIEKVVKNKFRQMQQALQLKSSKEICDMLNEYYEQYNLYETWKFFNSKEQIQFTDGDVSILYNKKWKRLFNGEFYHGLPLDLAHEITKFFMYSDEVKR